MWLFNYMYNIYEHIYYYFYTRPLYLEYKDTSVSETSEYYHEINNLNNSIYDVYTIKNIKILNKYLDTNICYLTISDIKTAILHELKKPNYRELQCYDIEKYLN